MSAASVSSKEVSGGANAYINIDVLYLILRTFIERVCASAVVRCGGQILLARGDHKNQQSRATSVERLAAPPSAVNVRTHVRPASSRARGLRAVSVWKCEGSLRAEDLLAAETYRGRRVKPLINYDRTIVAGGGGGSSSSFPLPPPPPHSPVR